MRVGFDVSQTGQLKAGCGCFADSLGRALIQTAPEVEFVLYPTFGAGYWDPDWATRTLNLPQARNARRGLGHPRFEQLERFWSSPPADLEARLGSPDVIHSNNYFCPSRLRRARLVFTLHDVAFAEHPEWTTPANWHTCFQGVFNASQYADAIVAVSHATRQRFLELFPHYPAERITVVYEASRFDGRRERPQPAALAGLRPGQFWLAVGTLEPRKNLHRLLEAYARLRAAGDSDAPLVLAGGRGWLLDDLDARINALGLGHAVQRLGYVDDACLEWLYQHCAAFCYPSLLEGFGLPVIEAMSLGAAVLTSNVSSLPEVAGDAAVLVDPEEVQSIYSGMRQLAHDACLRRQLGARAAARAQRFSWQSAAQQVMQLYRQVLHQQPRIIERNAALEPVGK